MQYSEYSSVDSDEFYDSDNIENESDVEEEKENEEEEESEEESEKEVKKQMRKYGIESKISMIDPKIYSRYIISFFFKKK